MSETNNIDDELLSAYLDNELAPEERARVEDRLAADPTARQLLDQFRAVSRAVNELPPAPLGHDLSDSVLRRAERAMLVSNPMDSGAPASAGETASFDVAPRFTIGRSVRGWVWAGLATAAALAIMAFESNSNREDKLPDSVAERRLESAEQVDSKPEAAAVAKSKLPEALSDSSAPSPPAMSAAPPDRIADGSGNGVASTMRREASGESRSGGENKESGLTGRGASLAAAGKFSIADAAKPSSGSTTTDLLVVHLQVKPVAFEQRAFDDVLLRNGITIEKSSDESETAAPGTSKDEKSKTLETLASGAPSPVKRPMSTVTASSQSQPSSSESAATAENTDLVLVEAPVEQIQSCLEELHKNDRDYLGVSVDDDRSLSTKSSTGNSPASAWQQYNRGLVPQRQNLQRAANNDFYYQTNQGPVEISRGTPLERGTQHSEQLRSLDETSANVSDQRGRAIRMRSQYPAETTPQFTPGRAGSRRSDSNEATQSTNPTTQGFSARGADKLPEDASGSPSNDTLQVLFILSAGDQPAASSPPATKAAK